MDSNKKVVFFDIDGTLASNKVKSHNMVERVPESSVKAIDRLKENNITPAIATGRGYLAVKPLAAALGIDSMVCSNGLSVVYQGKEIYQRFLSYREIEDTMEVLMPLEDITVIFETTKGNVLFKSGYMGGELKPEICMEQLEEIKEYEVYQLIVVGEDIKERVHTEIPGLQVKKVAPVAVNIYPEGLSKATGISEMLSILNIDKSEAVAFGDEENDLEMFETVGFSVAMGNGVEALKKIASYVTDSVDEDGIYNACLHLGLIK